MTTITVKNSEQIEKTSFDSMEDLAGYLFEHYDFGQLKPIDGSQLTADQNKRMALALESPKSKMFNI